MSKCPFRERFLQIIWNERLLCAKPACTDGRPLRIVSNGLWNRGKGPDFQNAVVLLDDTLCRGDIELHCLASEWFAHGHHRDPAYTNVVLHVVWENDLSAERRDTGLPTLELKNQLLPSWEQLFQSVEAAFYPHAKEIPPGACALRWALTDDTQLQEILTTAGLARFSRHGRDLLRRATETGLEQSLYEHLFDALGYAENRQQFQALAQALPLAVLQNYEQTPETLSALLFGAAGLLPDTTRQEVLPAFCDWTANAWKIWWRSGLTSQAIHWNSGCGRPLNSLWRRLAAGVFWLLRCECRPLEWLKSCRDTCADNPRALLKILRAPLETPPEWNLLRDFEHALPQPAALLGTERLNDLAGNVLLPFLNATAEMNGDSATGELVRNAWLLLPRHAENHLLKDAIHRFLTPPSRWRELLHGTAQQQGMMDIFQNFCLALDHDCQECPFVVR